MPRLTVSTCSLNQWALDFDGNRDRIVRSIERAKAAGSTLRIGPELEIPGYGCYDHFLESDTELHSWQVLAEILQSNLTDGILCDVGMPVSHRSVLYNCRIAVMHRRILHIRPKIWLANDGNYREMRFFTPWTRIGETESYDLPDIIRETTGQTHVPIGDALLQAPDTVLGVELCEELFTGASPHIAHALHGADIILLIVAALDNRQLRDLYQLAGDLGMTALVEVHDESETERAVDLGARLIGVNARNLKTLEVHREMFGRLAHLIPDDRVKVAESGIRGPQDIADYVAQGADAALVGEALVTGGDPSAAVAAMIEAGARVRGGAA